MVEDKWDGKLPDGAFANVSLSQLFSPWWWLHYMEAWAFWLWSFVWYTRIWMVRSDFTYNKEHRAEDS